MSAIRLREHAAAAAAAFESAIEDADDEELVEIVERAALACLRRARIERVLLDLRRERFRLEARPQLSLVRA